MLWKLIPLPTMSTPSSRRGRGPRAHAEDAGGRGPLAEPLGPVHRAEEKNKRVWASLERSMKEVVADGFLSALDRDENLDRRWVVLVDGNEDQMKAVRAQAAAIGIELTVVLDVIHVLEYLWKAGQALLGAKDTAAVEAWVSTRARRILEGHSSSVAAGIRRSATLRGGERRKTADTCCGYLLNHRDELRYHEFLRDGLPIATGVIEGACRSLVRDRMDITGARWGLPGAEAVLKLRSLRASGDFDAYWAFHQQRELTPRRNPPRGSNGETCSERHGREPCSLLTAVPPYFGGDLCPEQLDCSK